MAEIRNYTLNFGFGRSLGRWLGSLNFATASVAKLASTEVEHFVPAFRYG
jgi:hypothetical protein